MEEKVNLNHGHRQRLREKFLRGGWDTMPDYEKLELLLTFAIVRKDVKPISKKLFLQFGSLNNILDASFEELTQVDGIGENSATLILLLRQIYATYLQRQMEFQDSINSPQMAVDFVRTKIGNCKNETFITIFLDAQNHLINFELISGTINHAAIYPRNLIESALKYHAVSIIMAHNHPSAVCSPSLEDLKTTQNIAKALNTVGIKLIDHLIVSTNDFYSLADHGVLNK